jgi:amino acid adenylation domain-containing protein
VDLLTDSDRDQIFDQNHEMPPEVRKCLHEVVDNQAAREPNSPAVCGWDASFSYEELNTKATRLAHHLQAMGVGRNTIVPLCFERSSWTILAMLAVNKAGGAFVPLDPSYPDSVIRSRISDIGAKLILASANFSGRLEDLMDRVIVISEETVLQLPTSHLTVTSEATPDSLAYVLFTSGSTGKPKAVALEHAAICTSIAHHGAVMAFKSSSRCFQFASYVFDMCIGEIFTTLYYGGCVCVPSEADRTGDIAGAMNRMKVNIAVLTPSVVRLIEPNDVQCLQTLILGGEPVSDDIIRPWADKVQLINGYGPTECAVFSITGPLTWPRSHRQSIGTAVGSLSWIVDCEDHNRLLPVGCVGELLIHGVILARCYLGDEGKTAKSFITNPAWLPSDHPGISDRFYKTGDLVRYNTDMTISYVGRKDNQVKIHGQRVELGEVEHFLAGHVFINHSIALAPKTGPCKNRLVAVLMLKDQAQKIADNAELQMLSKRESHMVAAKLLEIRENLEIQLPAHMVPSLWILLDAVPFNTALKIDRQRIGQWVARMPENVYNDIINLDLDTFDSRVATPTGRRLRHIWSRVLNIPAHEISLDRSFFSLGGDSITAMQIVSACKSEKMQLSLQDILQSKTISKLALRVSETEKPQFTNDEEFGIPFELSPIQKTYFNCIAPRGVDQPEEHHFNQSFFLRLTGHVDSQQVSRAVQAIVSRHSMLRARFQRDQTGHWSQIVLGEATSETYLFNIHEVRDREEIIPIAESLQRSINILQGPVFGSKLFNTNEGLFIFLVAHHLVVDLVSWRIILQDLMDLLEAGDMDLEKPMPFHTWCDMQEEHARGGILDKSVVPYDLPVVDWVYWGIKDTANVQAARIERHFCLESADADFLLGSANEPFKTEPSDIIISAILQSFKEVFARQSSPLVYIEGHGRQPWDASIDLSSTVGWFTTIMPLLITSDTPHNLLDTLKTVKDARRHVAQNGRSNFGSRYLKPNENGTVGGSGEMEILVNFTGRQQQLERNDVLFKLDSLHDELARADVGENMRRLALFEIDVTVVGSTLKVSFGFNRLTNHQELIQRWLTKSQRTLQEVLQGLKTANPGFTLTDFPLLSMTQQGLEALEREALPALELTSLDDIEDIYPCSPTQQGILLSQIRSPGLYDVEQVSKIVSHNAAAVDIQLLQEAWQRVVDRHPTLRTVFIKAVSQNAIFDQVVLKRHRAKLVHIDCHNADEAVQILKAQQFATKNTTEPQHTLTLCVTAAGEVFCKIEISHALIDGMSISTITKDLLMAYDGTLDAGPGPLYSDYVSFLQQSASEAGINYWCSYLDSAQPCRLPVFSKQSSDLPINKSLTVHVEAERLYEASERYGVTVANIFQAAWGLVLRTYTGADQICFGYLVSGRDLPIEGIESAVGAFINMIVCRLDITAATSGAALVQEVHQDFLRGLPYQQCSLAEIQHHLGLGGSSLFNTALSLQRPESQDINSSSISLSKIFDNDPTEVSLLFLPHNQILMRIIV